MSETTNSFENHLVSEREILDALNLEGIDNPETVKLLIRYADQCHMEADLEVAENPDSKDVSNIANIKADIKIGSMYFQSENYRVYGIDLLEEAREAASQSEATKYLVEVIDTLLAE